MEYVAVPLGDSTAKVVPIPDDVVTATADRSSVLAYVADVPADVWAVAAVIALPTAAEPTPEPIEDAP
jgi:hypothetical protein